MSVLTLIHYSLCPFSRSIRLALAEQGVETELIEERPWEWREDFLELNPAGQLPILVDQDGPKLCGAYVISEYLAEIVPQGEQGGRGFSFFPGDIHARAETRRIVDWFHRKFDIEVSSHILDEKVYRRFSGEQGAPHMDRLRAGYDNLRYHLQYIGYLADTRNWLGGPELSFADLAAAAHLSSIDYLGDVPWQTSEAAKEWYARIKSRPSFRPLLADRIPGIECSRHYADLDF